MSEKYYPGEMIPVKEISELLDVTSSKVPELISGILKQLYSPEAGSNMGKAVGNLYKELIGSGVPQEVAVKMAADYMLSLKDVFKNMNFQPGAHISNKDD